MNETTTLQGLTGTSTIVGYSGTYGNGLATPLNGGSTYINPGVSIYDSSSNYSISTLTINQNNMNKQTKVAVFTVKRNEDNKVISSTFIKEFWVEIKNGGSVELAAAKQLDKDYDPDTTIIREIHICNF